MEGILSVFLGTITPILGSSGNQLEDKAEVIEEGRKSKTVFIYRQHDCLYKKPQ